MKKEGGSSDSWVDPTSPGSNLAVEFDRETQSLRFVYKSRRQIGRGCQILFLIPFSAVWVLVAIIAAKPATGPSMTFVVMLGLLPLGIIPLMHDQQIEIDTKSKLLVRRFKGAFLPWSSRTSAPLGETARFEVRAMRAWNKPDHYILFFIPCPDSVFTWWHPTVLGTTSDPAEGKTALERMAFGLNRFLDAVRKGEPNLERLAQPAPPGPFKP